MNIISRVRYHITNLSNFYRLLSYKYEYLKKHNTNLARLYKLII